MKIGVIGGSAFPANWNDWQGFVRAPELDTLADDFAGRAQLGPPSADLLGVRCGGSELLFLARHGASHHLLPAEINYRANLRMLSDAGVDAVIATHTVGGIDADIPVGGLALPDQVIDYTWGRLDTYAGGGEVRHVEFDAPFHPGLNDNLQRIAEAEGLSVKRGCVYGCTQGPRFESPAEVDRLERDGVAIVGMTAMPEACLAAELDLPYSSISLVVNAAAGRGTIELDAIHQAGRDGMSQIQTLLRALLQQGELLL